MHIPRSSLIEGEHTPIIIQLILSTDLAVIQLEDSHLILHISQQNLISAGCSWDHGKTRVVFVRRVSEFNAIELNAVLTFFENNSLLTFCLETRVSFALLC